MTNNISESWISWENLEWYMENSNVIRYKVETLSSRDQGLRVWG